VSRKDISTAFAPTAADDDDDDNEAATAAGASADWTRNSRGVQGTSWRRRSRHAERLPLYAYNSIDPPNAPDPFVYERGVAASNGARAPRSEATQRGRAGASPLHTRDEWR
jgi:hypothetical protein